MSSRWVEEDSDGRVEVHQVQPYEAVKAYLCPGCQGEIPPATGHLVVVPIDDADRRRHWHRACWDNRHRRRPRWSRRRAGPGR